MADSVQLSIVGEPDREPPRPKTLRRPAEQALPARVVAPLPAAQPHAPGDAPAGPLARPAECSAAAMELLSFDSRLLHLLPAAWTLGCQTERGQRLGFSTCDAMRKNCHAQSVAAFTGAEWLHIAVAAEHERAWPSDMDHFCDRRLSQPKQGLTLKDALAGMVPTAEMTQPGGWPVWRVLDQLGLTMTWVQ